MRSSPGLVCGCCRESIWAEDHGLRDAFNAVVSMSRAWPLLQGTVWADTMGLSVCAIAFTMGFLFREAWARPFGIRNSRRGVVSLTLLALGSESLTCKCLAHNIYIRQKGTSVWLLLQGSTWAGGPGQRDCSSAVHHRPLCAHMAGAGSTGLHAAGS